MTAIFADVVARHGDRLALKSGRSTVSYRDLDRKSDAAARLLGTLGVGAGDRVALVLPRSIEAIVAILAILKCGAVYVPLDPGNPGGATAALLTDCAPRLVVATRDVIRTLPAGNHKAIDVADLVGTSGDERPFPFVAASAEAAAYVMYTSGSTGKPKGVVVPHRGIVRLTVDTDYMTIGPDDVVLHTGLLAFDASTWEIWSALLNGASLAIVEDPVPSTTVLAETVRDAGVTALLLTTGLFHAVAETDVSAYGGVRLFLTGGDVLSPQHAVRMARALPGCRIVNAYGPTENTVITCTFDVPVGHDRDAPVPIGRPIRGTTAAILDDALRPVEDGDIGQLATGGAGVALGYLNSDALTAERFVVDTTGGTGRLYLTGDLARRTPDGSIEFLGRTDRQVKIAGKRIELDEIEHRLRADRRIADAAVMVRRSGDTSVISAYLKPATWPVPDDFAQRVIDDYRATVPAALVPAEVSVIEQFPLNANGKLDRKALPGLGVKRQPSTPPGSGAGQRTTAGKLVEIWSTVLARDTVPTDVNFFDLGGTSLAMVRVHAAIVTRLGRSLAMTDLFAHPTIEKLARFIDGVAAVQDLEASGPRTTSSGEIAIVGMAARFPGANTIDAFWDNLIAGRDTIRRFEADELEDAFDAETRARPDFVAAKPILDDVDLFDAAFFGFNARDAALTDPQQRVFLECVWQAFEDAGYDPKAVAGKIGIYAGSAFNTYFLHNVLATKSNARAFTSDFQVGSYQELLGALPEFVATRTAYKLDLRGPAVNVQSACSTSLLAVAQAVQALRAGYCDMCVAGAVSISFPQKRGYIHTEGGMVSKDGSCRPFDAAASGTVFGSGAGVVVLKRLEDAVRDGDHVYAVISGIGVNNDGADKIGFTAPSAAGQADAIATALSDAGVDADAIGLVEAHGTATPLGDPIEFSGLLNVFGAHDSGANKCFLGSVKANVGHLDAAAGIAGLIKAALVLDRGMVPPQINFETPNAAIDLDGSPFRIATRPVAWPRGDVPRRAGISSFGVGGTNVHVVLSEAPALPARPTGSVARPEILALSARSEMAVKSAAQQLAAHLAKSPDLPLADVAATLAHGRRPFPCRLAVVTTSVTEAIPALTALAEHSSSTARADAGVVFVFPGQGAQFPGMGGAASAADTVYAEWLERGLSSLDGDLQRRLQPLLSKSADGVDAATLAATELAQPALFIVEHAVAQALLARGVVPSALVGHSLGEFVAATVAGVFSFEDALRIVTLRGRLMSALPSGAMLAVRMSEERAIDLVTSVRRDGGVLDIAAVNGPELVTLAGPHDDIARVLADCEARNIAARRLDTSHAFHSAMMEPAIAPLRDALSSVKLSAPRPPMISTVTGALLSDAEATSPDYWARHGRVTVRFSDAARALLALTPSAIVEMGPGATLTSLLRQHCRDITAPTLLQTLRDESAAANSGHAIADAIAKLWTLGVAVTIPTRADARRVPLPTTPFERRRFWIDAEPVEPAARTSDPPAIKDRPMSNPPADAAKTAPMTKADPSLTRSIIRILEDISGETIGEDAHAVPFLELGFDSLLLGQVAQRLQKTFGVKLTFRQLMSTYGTVTALADHIAPTQPKTPKIAAPAQVTQPAEPAASGSAVRDMLAFPLSAVTAARPVSSTSADGDVASLMRDQLAALQNVIAQQLAVLQGGTAVTVPRASAPAAPEPAPANAVPGSSAATVAQADPAIEEVEGESRFKIYKAGGTRSSQALTDAQQTLIADIVARTNKMTPGSKSRAASSRAHLADPRSVAGFRAEWKEIVYPIVVDKAQGAYLHDVDGNRYIDLVNGYGQIAFGHSPDFVVAAISRQLAQGFPIGPQTPLAAEVADLFCELTGNERATFCVTGSEAVMAAMRVARAVTGRNKVVYFGGDYHGQFDEVLAKGLGSRAKAPGAQPIAPGIPRESVSNMVVLAYDSPSSLAYIRDHADEIAAVLVETVQSRHPALVPVDFLKQLRTITAQDDIALVFDEVVTGFRVHPGGMQAVLGIRADMATYGKVAGGGMPIGILAGNSRFMDALDGGAWQYGDDSVPEVAPTFFAGTFVRHPLVLAAVRATLAHIKAQGPDLQAGLDRKTKSLVDRLNTIAETRGIRTRFERYSSYFYASFASEDPLGSLLYPLMRLDGVHIYEGFTCFLTTAHTDDHLDQIARSFEAALVRLQAAGILSPASAADAPGIEQATELRPSSVLPSNPTAVLPDSVPLTEPQCEVYLAAQLGDEASIAFNESVSLSLDGVLDTVALREAINDVIARHDALRAFFGTAGDVMSVAPALRIDVPLIDVSGEADPAAALEARLAGDARNPFDLDRGPLVRAEIVKRDPASHVLVLTAHHIICDGWSINTILEELAAMYALRATGVAASLPAPLAFRQFALEQSRMPVPTETDAFWARMHRDTEAFDLPSDRPRPDERTWRGASTSAHIDGATLKSFKKAAARAGASLFNALFGVTQVLMARLSGSSDITLAVPMAGQSDVDAQSFVGHCVNFLPVRSAVDLDAPFSTHLERLGRVFDDAYPHRNTTLGRIVRTMELKRTLGRTPLTDVQFNLERISGGISFPGLAARVTPNPKAAVNFDLFINCIESDDGLRIDADYSTDLYDRTTIERWLGHFRCLVASAAHDLSATSGALKLLDADAERWLVEALNDTAHDFDRDALIHQLVEAQVRRTPDAIAVTSGSVSLTYAELDRAANRLANFMLQRGLQPGHRVAVAVHRSAETLVALLGVLKCGCAYVPLDPTHPVARLQQTIETAKVSLIVTNDATQSSLAQGTMLHVDIVRDRSAIAATSSAAPRVREHNGSADPDAYVIFTSGSTGTPKGVAIGHRAVVNFLTSMSRTPGLQSSDTLVAVTTVCFDIAVLELFLPLVNGARVVIADRETVTDGFQLVELIERERASVVQATPSLWRILLEAGFKPRRGLKMLCGGEPLARDLADQLIADGAELWNMYGPTETTIWSSCYRVDRGPITIGRPIDNTSLHILDARGQLTAPGVAGDLHIGGEGLAKGYFDRDDLTAAAFRMLSIGGRAPQRLYRTGDVARRLPVGNIELIGRADQQIKLRGYRIELEDIETALRLVTGIAHAAVAVDRADPTAPRLIAYVVPRSGHRLSGQSIATQLSARLPDYMVPSVYLEVERLPATGNGKLDRKALTPQLGRPLSARDLASPYAQGVAVADNGQEPSGPAPAPGLEEQIAAVWREVLGMPSIASDVSLLRLGADSLHLFRIAARLQAQGLKLQARDLLRHPTIAAQANLQREAAPAIARPSKIPALGAYRGGARRVTGPAR